MATFNWSQEIGSGGPAITYGYQRKITLRGTYVVDTTKKTVTIQAKQIEIYYYGGYQGEIYYYLDGKILINNTQVYLSTSTPATDAMYVYKNGTYKHNISTTAVTVSYSTTLPTFTVQMVKQSHSAFYWVNGASYSQNSQWTASNTVYTVKAVCTISYNKNGGSGTMSPTYVAYGSSYNVVDNSFTAPAGQSTTYTITFNSNYTGSTNTTKTVTNVLPKEFDTWHQNSASGTALAPGTAITVKADITLYATWKDGTLQKGTIQLGSKTRSNTTATGYTVSFDTQGGSSVGDLTSTKTTKYTFQGWMTSASGTEIEYDSTTSYSFTQDTTLYAKWSSTVTNGSLNLPAAPLKTGYNLLGWGTSAQATTYKQPGDSITPTKNMTYYAIWKAAGNIRIYVDGEYKVALPYIYTGNEWKLVIPYIKSSTDWKIIAG